jgi:hypothetical protein
MRSIELIAREVIPRLADRQRTSALSDEAHKRTKVKFPSSWIRLKSPAA